MPKVSKQSYEALDRPEVLNVLFHPRPEPTGLAAPPGSEDILIPVESDIKIGGRIHTAGSDVANVLFFHGNGEIVADYDDFGPLLKQIPLNFLAVDYRGYGRSGGRPSVSAMMQDCHHIFDYVCVWLKENSYSGPLILMGRSLGSASALELTSCYPGQISGLIIESGFAYTEPLLQLLGLNFAAIGSDKSRNIDNLSKIRTFANPTLIIHAEYDHIIPFSDGQVLFDACPAENKRLLKIEGANHNDIFLRGLGEYVAALKAFVEEIK